MNVLHSKDEQGIIWVKNKANSFFGIVSQTKVVDANGLPYQNDTLTVLEDNGFQLNQDWGNESTYIDFKQENGETARIVFIGGDANIIEA